jgi:hypothetical protein
MNYMKTLLLILFFGFGLHGAAFASPVKATKIVDKKSIPELKIVYRPLLGKQADGTRLLTFEEYRAFHQRLLNRVSSDSDNILRIAERWEVDPLDVAGELLAKDCFRALSIALEGISKRKDSVRKADLEYIAQALKALKDGDDLAIDALIEMTIVSKGAMGSRDVGEMVLNLTTYRGHLEAVRPLKATFEKMGRIGKAPGQPGPDGKGIGVVGTHYSRYDDYRAGLPDSPIHIKPNTNYGSIYDPLQNNKSVGGIRGGIHEVDTADYLANPANGYDLLQLGRKFMTDTERLSDIDAVAFERALGHLHFIQAKSSNGALQRGARKFGTNMEKQLAQLPTTGQHAAAQGLSIGERCGRHVRFALPAGANLTDAQKVAAIEKMAQGMTKGPNKLIDVRNQIREGLGLPPGEGVLSASEVEAFFIAIP